MHPVSYFINGSLQTLVHHRGACPPTKLWLPINADDRRVLIQRLMARGYRLVESQSLPEVRESMNFALSFFFSSFFAFSSFQTSNFIFLLDFILQGNQTIANQSNKGLRSLSEIFWNFFLFFPFRSGRSSGAGLWLPPHPSGTLVLVFVRSFSYPALTTSRTFVQTRGARATYKYTHRRIGMYKQSQVYAVRNHSRHRRSYPPSPFQFSSAQYVWVGTGRLRVVYRR